MQYLFHWDRRNIMATLEQNYLYLFWWLKNHNFACKHIYGYQTTLNSNSHKGIKTEISSKPTNSIEEQGYHVFKMFEKVVKWTVNHCVQGLQPEQTHSRSLLLRLRKGESILDDWKLLLTRQPSNVANLSQFDDAARLY